MPENVNLDNVVSDAMAEKVLTKLLLTAALEQCSVGTAARRWMDLLIAKRATGGAQ